MSTHHFIASADFSKRTLKALAKKGIYVIGVQLVPDMSNPLPWANPQKCYCLDNNGEGQVRDLFQVIALGN